MFNRIQTLFSRASDIIKNEGPLEFIKAATGKFYRNERYYLSERQIPATIIEPPIEDCRVRIIRDDKEALDLAKECGFDFREGIVRGKERLSSGAIAFCLLAGGEFACITWIATNEKSKQAVDPLPYYVDFEKGQIVSGGTLTIPKFRNKRLMTYLNSKRNMYLLENGYNVMRSVKGVHNIASQKMSAHIPGDVRYAEARLLTILGFDFWKETPINQTK